jgi:hypothetical protein
VRPNAKIFEKFGSYRFCTQKLARKLLETRWLTDRSVWIQQFDCVSASRFEWKSSFLHFNYLQYTTMQLDFKSSMKPLFISNEEEEDVVVEKKNQFLKPLNLEFDYDDKSKKKKKMMMPKRLLFSPVNKLALRNSAIPEEDAVAMFKNNKIDDFLGENTVLFERQNSSD